MDNCLIFWFFNGGVHHIVITHFPMYYSLSPHPYYIPSPPSLYLFIAFLPSISPSPLPSCTQNSPTMTTLSTMDRTSNSTSVPPT